jgi:hypothetical protein
MTVFMEVISFMLQRKKLWLIPIFVVLFMVLGLIILAEGSVVTPFIYALF